MTSIRYVLLFALLFGGAVYAWQYEDEFTLDQLGGRPGGGGNWATGGKKDFKVQCVMCHVPPDGGFTQRITAQVGFVPALQTGSAYSPGQNYDVTVTMNGEHLGTTMGANHNQMGASFEDAAGNYVGRLQSDTGFSKGGTCPNTLTNAHFNAYDAGSTTVTFAGCNAIVGRGRGAGAGGHTVWRFRWQAPAAGAGPVTLYYGVVDASGDEKSVNDDGVMGTVVMPEGT